MEAEERLNRVVHLDDAARPCVREHQGDGEWSRRRCRSAAAARAVDELVVEEQRHTAPAATRPRDDEVRVDVVHGDLLLTTLGLGEGVGALALAFKMLLHLKHQLLCHED